MNYVHYTLMYLIDLVGDVISWLFNIELVNYEDTSITFGEAFIYFFIVSIVISLLLHARYGNIGTSMKNNHSKSKSNGPAKLKYNGPLDVHAYDKNGNELA